MVAIVHPNHPLARVKRISCADLAKHRLVFRTKQSSTQRVVDRAFRAAGVKPKPEIVLDTRDGVFEAVANELGVGLHVGIRIKPRRQDCQNSRARNGDADA